MGVSVQAATVVPDAGRIQARFWVRNDGMADPGQWYLFTHVVNAAGEILINKQVALASAKGPSPERDIRYYTVTFDTRPPEATDIAFGFYRPRGNQGPNFLLATQGQRDWDGRRVHLPLP